MARPTVTFKSILTSMAFQMGLNGYSSLQSNDLSRLANFATRVMDMIWRCPNRLFAFDFSVTSDTITITDGKFALSEIDYSDWWSLWTQDPRPYQSSSATWPNLWPWRVRGLADNDGIWPQTNQSTVFVFWRTAAPRFTSTAVDTGTNYAAGSLVYDASSEDCYLALEANAPGNDLTNAKWERQLIPAVLQDPMIDWMDAMRLNALSATDKKRDVQKDADQWLDLEMMRQMPRDGSGPPWAYNGAPGYYDRMP